MDDLDTSAPARQALSATDWIAKFEPFPEHWQIVPLAEAAEFTHKPRALNPGGYERVPFIPMEAISDNGTQGCSFNLKPGTQISSGVYCEPGDILLARITPSLENGKQGIVPHDVPNGFAYATTEVYPLKARRDLLDRDFLFALLRHPVLRAELAGKLEGSTGRQRLPKHVLANLPVPLPPLPEQRAIAQVLRAVQRAKEATEHVIAATRELKKSLMRHLFTYGPVPVDQVSQVRLKDTEIGPVPEHWKVEPLASCALVQTGVAKGRRLPIGEDVVTVPYLRVANVQRGFLELAEMKIIQVRRRELPRFALRRGDVVLTEGGDFDKLGRGFIWEGQIEPCVHQNHVFAVRPFDDGVRPQYLAHWTQSEKGRKYFLTVAHRTTHLATINVVKLKGLPIPRPEAFEQESIARAIDSIDRRILAEEQRQAALGQLFGTLLHHLMTGQVRVGHAL